MGKLKRKQPSAAQAASAPRGVELFLQRIRQEARERLRQGRSVDLFVRLAGDVFHGAEWLIEQTRSQESVTTACEAGCNYCCHLQVGVTPPEVLRLAEHIRRSFTVEEQAALKERLADLDEKTHGMAPWERNAERLPCALLADGRCSVYSARPIPCMGWNSLDADQCRQSFEGNTLIQVEPFVRQVQTGYGAQAGLLGALEEAGYRPEILELTAALRIALETPRAAERWVAGDPVFLPARQGTVRDSHFVRSETWRRGQ